MSQALRIAACVLPVAVVAAVWFPFVEHYYVPRVRIPESSLHAYVDAPSDSVLAALGRQFLGFRVSATTGLPPDSPEEQLRHFGFFQVAIDLDDFERTGDARQFAEIVRFVVEFSKHANGRFAYGEFLWNDHAIANREFVLARFWQHYRRQPTFNADDAAAILEHVAKNAEFLARDDHFTYWTNHGVMQSLGLLHAANAFPALPDRERFVQIALERLEQQLHSYVADSGWIMEHSAGYQEFGANLLDTLLIELEQLDEEGSPEWRSKARESLLILGRLVRPGGSLPNFGDSDTALADTTGAPPSCAAFTDAAARWSEGYYVAWDIGTAPDTLRCAQTVVVWPSFVSNAHRRPNDLSVHYWVDGVDYAMASGYWPYGDEDRLEAIGWRGSNAPHLRGESEVAGHVVDDHGACLADGLRFIDLERRLAVGGSVRRQVVDLGVDGVLVLDSREGGDGRPVESVWRIAEAVSLIDVTGRVLRRGTPSGGMTHVMQVGSDASLASLGDVYARDGRSSPEKFSSVAAREPVPAYVVSSSEPSLVALTSAPAGQEPEPLRLMDWTSAQQWRIASPSGVVSVQRQGAAIERARTAGGPAARCEVLPPPDDAARLRSMETSFATMAARYPLFNAWTLYRVKATLAVGALLLAQLVALALLAKLARPRLQSYAVLAMIAGWFALGGYLTLVYLAQ